jgi:hypothetical protein
MDYETVALLAAGMVFLPAIELAGYLAALKAAVKVSGRVDS